MSDITQIEIYETNEIVHVDVIETFEVISIAVYDGRPGQDGADGQDGVDGQDGIDGQDGPPGPSVWGLLGGDINTQLDLKAKLDAKIAMAMIGVANGIVPLDNGTKISADYFPDELLGNVKFRGTYNGAVVSSASTTYNGFPLPTAAAQNSGIYFIVTADFTRSGINYNVGDWILSLGAAGYSKVDNSDSVTTVFGRLGNIVALETDYEAFYPRLSQTYANPAWIGSLAKSKVGLSEVDNTSDINKPVSTAQQTAINTAVANLERYWLNDTTDRIAAAGTLGEKAMQYYMFAANELRVGSRITIDVQVNKSGGSTSSNIYLKHNTSAAIPGANILTFNAAATAIQQIRFSVTLIVKPGNIMQVLLEPTVATGVGSSTALITSFSFNPAVSNYFFSSGIANDTVVVFTQAYCGIKGIY